MALGRGLRTGILLEGGDAMRAELEKIGNIGQNTFNLLDRASRLAANGIGTFATSLERSATSAASIQTDVGLIRGALTGLSNATAPVKAALAGLFAFKGTQELIKAFDDVRQSMTEVRNVAAGTGFTEEFVSTFRSVIGSFGVAGERVGPSLVQFAQGAADARKNVVSLRNELFPTINVLKGTEGSANLASDGIFTLRGNAKDALNPLNDIVKVFKGGQQTIKKNDNPFDFFNIDPNQFSRDARGMEQLVEATARAFTIRKKFDAAAAVRGLSLLTGEDDVLKFGAAFERIGRLGVKNLELINQALGRVPTSEQQNNLLAYEGAWQNLRDAIDATRRPIVAAVYPALTTFLNNVAIAVERVRIGFAQNGVTDAIAAWAEKVRQSIQPIADDIVTLIGNMFKPLNQQAPLNTSLVKSLAFTFGLAADAIRLVTSAVGVLAHAFQGLILSPINNLFGTTFRADILLAGLALLKITGVLALLNSAFAILRSTALLTAASLLKNPFAVAVIGIGALALAINKDTPIVQKFWDVLSGGGEGAFDAAGGATDGMKEVKKQSDELSGGLKTLYDNLLGIGSTGAAGMNNLSAATAGVGNAATTATGKMVGLDNQGKVVSTTISSIANATKSADGRFTALETAGTQATGAIANSTKGIGSGLQVFVDQLPAASKNLENAGFTAGSVGKELQVFADQLPRASFDLENTGFAAGAAGKGLQAAGKGSKVAGAGAQKAAEQYSELNKAIATVNAATKTRIAAPTIPEPKTGLLDRLNDLRLNIAKSAEDIAKNLDKSVEAATTTPRQKLSFSQFSDAIKLVEAELRGDWATAWTNAKKLATDTLEAAATDAGILATQLDQAAQAATTPRKQVSLSQFSDAARIVEAELRGDWATAWTNAKKLAADTIAGTALDAKALGATLQSVFGAASAKVGSIATQLDQAAQTATTPRQQVSLNQFSDAAKIVEAELKGDWAAAWTNAKKLAEDTIKGTALDARALGATLKQVFAAAADNVGSFAARLDRAAAVAGTPRQQALLTQFSDALKVVESGLRGEWATAWENAKKLAADTLTSVASDAKALGATLKQALTDAANNVGSLATRLDQSAQTASTPRQQTSLNQFSDGLKVVEAALRGEWAKAWENAQKLATDTIKGTGQDARALGATLKQAFGAAAEQAGSLATRLDQAAQAATKPRREVSLNQFSDAAKAVEAVLKGEWATAWENAKKLASDTIKGTGLDARALGATLKEAFAGAARQAGSLATQLDRAAQVATTPRQQTSLNQFSDAAKAVEAVLTGEWATAWENAKKLAADTLKGTGQDAKALGATLKEVLAPAAAGFGSLATQLDQAAQNATKPRQKVSLNQFSDAAKLVEAELKGDWATAWINAKKLAADTLEGTGLDLEALGTIIASFAPKVDDFGKPFGNALRQIGNLIQLNGDLIRGDWSKAWTDLKATAVGTLTAVGQDLRALDNALAPVGDGIGRALDAALIAVASKIQDALSKSDLWARFKVEGLDVLKDIFAGASLPDGLWTKFKTEGSGVLKDIFGDVSIPDGLWTQFKADSQEALKNIFSDLTLPDLFTTWIDDQLKALSDFAKRGKKLVSDFLSGVSKLGLTDVQKEVLAPEGPPGVTAPQISKFFSDASKIGLTNDQKDVLSGAPVGPAGITVPNLPGTKGFTDSLDSAVKKAQDELAAIPIGIDPQFLDKIGPEIKKEVEESLKTIDIPFPSWTKALSDWLRGEAGALTAPEPAAIPAEPAAPAPGRLQRLRDRLGKKPDVFSDLTKEADQFAADTSQAITDGIANVKPPEEPGFLTDLGRSFNKWLSGQIDEIQQALAGIKVPSLISTAQAAEPSPLQPAEPVTLTTPATPLDTGLTDLTRDAGLAQDAVDKVSERLAALSVSDAATAGIAGLTANVTRAGAEVTDLRSALSLIALPDAISPQIGGLSSDFDTATKSVDQLKTETVGLTGETGKLATAAKSAGDRVARIGSATGNVKAAAADTARAIGKMVDVTGDLTKSVRQTADGMGKMVKATDDAGKVVTKFSDVGSTDMGKMVRGMDPGGPVPTSASGEPQTQADTTKTAFEAVVAGANAVTTALGKVSDSLKAVASSMAAIAEEFAKKCTCPIGAQPTQTQKQGEAAPPEQLQKPSTRSIVPEIDGATTGKLKTIDTLIDDIKNGTNNFGQAAGDAADQVGKIGDAAGKVTEIPFFNREKVDALHAAVDAHNNSLSSVDQNSKSAIDAFNREAEALKTLGEQYKTANQPASEWARINEQISRIDPKLSVGPNPEPWDRVVKDVEAINGTLKKGEGFDKFIQDSQDAAKRIGGLFGAGGVLEQGLDKFGNMVTRFQSGGRLLTVPTPEELNRLIDAGKVIREWQGNDVIKKLPGAIFRSPGTPEEIEQRDRLKSGAPMSDLQDPGQAAVDSIANADVPQQPGFLQKIGDAIRNWTPGEVSFVGKAFADTPTTEPFAPLSNWTDDIGKWVDQQKEDIGDGLATMPGTPEPSFLDSWGSAISSWSKSIGQSISDTLFPESELKDVDQSVENLAEDSSKKIGDAISTTPIPAEPGFLTQLGSDIDQWLPGVIDKIQTALNSVQAPSVIPSAQAATPVAGGLETTAAPTADGSALPAVAADLTTIQGQSTDVLSSIAESASTLVSTIASAITDGYQKIADFASALLDQAAAFAETRTADVNTQVQDQLTTLTDFASSAVDQLNEAFGTVFETMQSAGESAFSALTDAANTLIDLVNSAASAIDTLVGAASSAAGSAGAGAGLAGGGYVRGPGTGTSDDVLAWLSNKEFVARAKAVNYYGPRFFHQLNRMAIPREALPRFGGGGQVGRPARTALTVPVLRSMASAIQVAHARVPTFSSGGVVMPGFDYARLRDGLRAAAPVPLPAFADGGLIDVMSTRLVPSVPRFKSGGVVAQAVGSGAGKTPLVIQIDGHAFHTEADDAVADSLIRAVRRRRLASAGRKPGV